MSVELTQSILALHAVWSICVPIAIVETFVPDRRTRPWLGRTGLTVTAVLYVLGAGLVFWGNYTEEHFLASPAQLIGIGAAIVALVLIALSLRSRRPSADEAAPPRPWAVGAAALALTSLYWGPANLVMAGWYEWVGVTVWCTAVALCVLLVSRWSRRPGWGRGHRFALAAGATLTYVWTAFPVRPEAGGSLTADLASNVVFGAVAIAVLALAARALARTSTGPREAPARLHGAGVLGVSAAYHLTQLGHDTGRFWPLAVDNQTDIPVFVYDDDRCQGRRIGQVHPHESGVFEFGGSVFVPR